LLDPSGGMKTFFPWFLNLWNTKNFDKKSDFRSENYISGHFFEKKNIFEKNYEKNCAFQGFRPDLCLCNT